MNIPHDVKMGFIYGFPMLLAAIWMGVQRLRARRNKERSEVLQRRTD